MDGLPVDEQRCGIDQIDSTVQQAKVRLWGGSVWRARGCTLYIGGEYMGGRSENKCEVCCVACSRRRRRRRPMVRDAASIKRAIVMGFVYVETSGGASS